MTKRRTGGNGKSGSRKASASAERVRRAAAGLQELQKQIRRRSTAKLSDIDTRSAIDAGRR